MDIFKKLVLLMVILMPVSYASDVILVSDNFADKLVAQTIADELDEFVLIESPWGNFSNDTLNEILNETPENVVIIGGPVAVPENYTTALEDENITVERINGSDRFDTNNLTIYRFKDLFVNKTIVIIYAYENETYNITINNTNVAYVLANNSTVSSNIMEDDEFNGTVVVMNDSAFNYSGLLKRLQNHGFQVSTAAMPGNVLKAKIERRMNTIQTSLQALNQNGINTSELDTTYGELCDAYDGGNYSYAYALAIQLEDDLKAKQYKTTGNANVEKTVKVKTNNGKSSDDDSDDEDEEETEYENETEEDDINETSE